MRADERRELLASIAATVADYRVDEISPIDADYVEAWVSQFADADQPHILSEMDALLKRCYFSRRRVVKGLKELLFDEDIQGPNPLEALQETKFLRIWRKGSSQRDLLAITGEILSKKGIDIESCGEETPKAYIYVDDGLYSGNTVLYDFKNSNWFDEAIPGTTLYLLFLAFHQEGAMYVHNKIDDFVRPKKIKVKLWGTQKLFNRRGAGEKQFDCFWPLELTGNEYVDAYVAQLKEEWQNWFPPMFRPARVPQVDEMFSSPKGRKILEQALLKAGAEIVTWPTTAKAEMRPMGYEKLKSLGFGTPIVTYRNISNNSPLALWWGDPSMPSSHPFSKWQPLFPRKGNESSLPTWL